MPPSETTPRRDRLISCLLGGAIGDLIGGSFDRSSLAQMRARAGGDVDGPTASSRIGDDTQLTLFTLEGLMRGEMRSLDRGLCHLPSVVWHAYLRWGHTQGLAFPAGTEPFVATSWLAEQPQLQDRGNASPRCLEVIATGNPGSLERRPNRSDGSGAIMRLAPVGMRWQGTAAADTAAELAALTHGADRALVASSAYATIVAALLDGVGLETAVQHAVELLSANPGGDVLGPATTKALHLARDQPGDPDALHQLGSGRTSLSALLHAIYATACTDGFAQAVLVAVNQDGTSATSAALTGQLAGLLYRLEQIPADWRIACPVDGLIVELVDDWLAIQGSSSFGYGDNPPTRKLTSRYPPN
jgi:ADP-ribosylglycohydrolase